MNSEPMTTREFNRVLQGIMQAIKNVGRLEETIKTLGRGEALRYEQQLANGESQIILIGMRHVATFKVAIQTSIWDLRRDYSRALAYRKRLKPLLGSNGRWPVILRPEAIALFTDIGLDLDKVPLFRDEHLVMNTAIMTLAAIYSKHYKMYHKVEGTELTRLAASDHMRQTLATLQDDLQQRGFNFDDFSFTRWATIFSTGRVKTTGAERKQILAAKGVQLADEAVYFRDVNTRA